MGNTTWEEYLAENNLALVITTTYCGASVWRFADRLEAWSHKDDSGTYSVYTVSDKFPLPTTNNTIGITLHASYEDEYSGRADETIVQLQSGRDAGAVHAPTRYKRVSQV